MVIEAGVEVWVTILLPLPLKISMLVRKYNKWESKMRTPQIDDEYFDLIEAIEDWMINFRWWSVGNTQKYIVPENRIKNHG